MDMYNPGYFSIFVEKLSKMFGLNIRYFIRGGFWIILRYGVVSICGLAVTVSFARWTEPDFFGRYQYVLSLLSLFSIGALPGLAFPLMQEFNKKNERAYFLAITYSFLFGILSSLFLFVLAPYFIKNYSLIHYSILYIVVFLPFIYALNYWYIFLEYHGKFSIVSIVLSVQSILFSSAIIGQIFRGGYTLESLIFSYLGILFLINFCMNIFVLSKIYRSNVGTGNISLWYGIEITLQKGIFILVDIALPFFIPLVFSFNSLALYQIGVFFAVAFGGLVSGLSSLYIPLLFKYEHLDYRRVVFQNLFLGLALFGLYGMVIYFLYPIFYGQKYLVSQNIAWIFSISVLCFPLRVFLQNFFGSRKKNGIIIRTYGVALIASMIGFFIFSKVSFEAAVLSQVILFNAIIITVFSTKYFSSVK